MSRSTISTFQLFALFPDEESARVYLEGRIWPSGPVCPACGSGERIIRPMKSILIGQKRNDRNRSLTQQRRSAPPAIQGYEGKMNYTAKEIEAKTYYLIVVEKVLAGMTLDAAVFSAARELATTIDPEWPTLNPHLIVSRLGKYQTGEMARRPVA